VFSKGVLASTKTPAWFSDYFLGAGGLLPRPGPEGLPVLLGAFLRVAVMAFLQEIPRKIGVRGPGAYLADAGSEWLKGKGA
jgi:hypothetical protein